MKKRTPEEIKASVDKTIKELEEGVKNVFTSEKYLNYLKVMSRFHNYSAGNVMLISLQRPDATRVAGFRAWNEFERSVKKGEKGIKILAPMNIKKELEMEKIDENGNKVIENREINFLRFRNVYVFDYAQTEGKPLPRLVNELTNDMKDYEKMINALKESSKVPVGFEDMKGINGYYDFKENRIAIKSGMSQEHTFKTFVHELAHSRLHNPDVVGNKDRNTIEIEAESISFVVVSHYNVDSSDFSFGYVASWSKGRELEELKKSLETIQKESSSMICDITKALEKDKVASKESVRDNLRKISLDKPERVGSVKVKVVHVER